MFLCCCHSLCILGEKKKTFTLGGLFSPSSGRVHLWNFVFQLKVDDPLVAGLHVVWPDCSSLLQRATQPVKNCELFLMLIHRAPAWITLSSADKTDSCIVYSFPHRFVLELPPHNRMWTFIPEGTLRTKHQAPITFLYQPINVAAAHSVDKEHLKICSVDNMAKN